MRRTALSLACFIVLLAGCASTLETVYVPAERKGWKLGHGSNRPGATLAEFIPTNENISNWSRMLTIQLLEREQNSPAAVMKVLQSRMRARCPNAKWNVVAEDTSSVTYEWALSGCPGQPDQHEVARLLKGNDGVHRIAYVRKVAQLEHGEREMWLKTFLNSYVEKGGKRIAIAP